MVGKGFKHFLLPRVELEKNPEAILKKLKLDSVKRLPRVKAEDPSLEGIECKPGDMVRVENKNPVTGLKEEYYRVVVE
ncbi:DNA-directed RNA polymerase subunit H [Candidatus Micrarchaeota archaeon CG_4_10_14_0_2_um_filter_60_11]|nr:MAG: hypothetical protein AUJ16_00615 [Candidatus Micrarchaeota archaeon CG1_02_60_51]PIN95986.1 MAG: DNA-directed RNA polymerase subunit H [Candidatus Micrarchaeota archaeon CG10_big_fil_rev_8_21_14_0_10_60_32]PIO01845.1 MAG: DNA-directed RNA polymerase subunit H [Candidatus Micrarchaeota archaeon CG09_land_8_20_14_0_10_60_16]PIY91145.1 MAG: DNA-directed RNA polymerase subunit H [Candidatus Micrarchaeota archaeon CG_4_10_14_0_8_um_filter_60_7]PIZ91209.1 MAG: DNA-directed RNA polymerase subu